MKQANFIKKKGLFSLPFWKLMGVSSVCGMALLGVSWLMAVAGLCGGPRERVSAQEAGEPEGGKP